MEYPRRLVLGRLAWEYVLVQEVTIISLVGENSYDMKHDYRLRTPFHIFVAELNQHVHFKWSSF